MIAKRPTKRNSSQSSFKNLVNYIDRSNSNEPLLIKITNCSFENKNSALREIEATQKRNTRSKKDKTYHLVVSFPEGEIPNGKTIDDIEQSLCDSIGMNDHQRMSVIHDDTKCLHLHIAINTVNPNTFNLVNNRNDFLSLKSCCSEMEIKHHLTPVISDEKKDRRAFSGDDIESHQGISSFKQWVNNNKKAIISALSQPSWPKVNKKLSNMDLEIRKRGRGFVLSSRTEKAFIKLSGVGREFTQSSMEKRLGEMREEGKHTPEHFTIQYKPAPLSDSQLWNRFNLFKSDQSQTKKEKIGYCRQQRNVQLQQLKERYQSERQSIQRQLITNKEKRAFYKGLHQRKKQQEIQIKHNCQEAISDIHKKYRLLNWKEYLVDQAMNDNKEALDQLRKIAKRKTSNHPLDTLSGAENYPFMLDQPYTINKDGTVIYAEGAIKDTGRDIQVHATKDQEDMFLKAIDLAQERFGKPLVVNGDDDFKKYIVRLTAKHRLSVTFADEKLNSIHDALVEESSQIAHKNNLDKLIDEWIEKRNQTAQRVQEILPHRHYTQQDSKLVSYLYQGQRHLSDKQSVALLSTGKEMLVKPITSKETHLLKNIKIGTAVSVDKQDVLKRHKKGLSR